MAVTVTAQAALGGANSEAYDIEATADPDTTATITHTIGATPKQVVPVPILAAARISLWCITGIGSTTITATKATTAGSGAAGNQVRVHAIRPHTVAL